MAGKGSPARLEEQQGSSALQLTFLNTLQARVRRIMWWIHRTLVPTAPPPITATRAWWSCLLHFAYVSLQCFGHNFSPVAVPVNSWP